MILFVELDMTLAGKKLWAGVVIAFLLACLCFTSSCNRQVAVEDIRRDAAVLAIEKVIPSVVNIATAREITYRDFQNFFGDLVRLPLSKPEEVPNSVGSGVIISDDGYVLTSLHVVQGTSRIQVQLWDGRLYGCDWVARAPYGDMALLKIRAQQREKFKVIPFARDDDLLLGETVLALGDPLALGGTVTKGILSSKARRRPMNGPLDTKDWLQTDAAINEGNSGGPLVNLRGEMIGLNVATATNSQNIGFAIPVRQLQIAIAQFFSPEVTDSLWFGARIKAGNGPLRVDYLQRNSPAARGGLHVGDEILELNGRPVSSVIQFNRELCGTAANGNLQATLRVLRNGQRADVKVEMIPFQTLFQQRLGIAVRELTPQESAAVPFRIDQAYKPLIIEQVQENSPAAAAKLQKGFFIAGIDGQMTHIPRELADVLSTKNTGDTAKLMVIVQQTDGATVRYQSGVVDLIMR